jgi:hypothetical protein
MPDGMALIIQATIGKSLAGSVPPEVFEAMHFKILRDERRQDARPARFIAQGLGIGAAQ